MPSRKKPKAAEKRPVHPTDELIEESRRLREQAAETAARMRELAAAIAAAAAGNGPYNEAEWLSSSCLGLPAITGLAGLDGFSCHVAQRWRASPFFCWLGAGLRKLIHVNHFEESPRVGYEGTHSRYALLESSGFPA